MDMKAHMALPQLVLNVPALANQSREVVERILGRPERTGGVTVSQNEKVAYKGGKVEVLYANGKAKWIKLYNPRGMEFSQQSLSKLGLPPKKPTYLNRNCAMSWSKICNLEEVSLYSDSNGGVSSVLVCARLSASVPKSMNRRAPLTRSGRSFWTTPITLPLPGVSTG
jgi:hypothetical protein